MHETAKISALYNLGRLYAERQEYSLAISSYKLALARRPDYYAPPSIYNLLGELSLQTMLMRCCDRWLLANMEEWKHRKRCYINLLSSAIWEIFHFLTTIFTEVFNCCAKMLNLTTARLTKKAPFLTRISLKLLSVILKLSSRYYWTDILWCLGEAYFYSGDLNKAEWAYQKSLESKPDHLPAHLTMARLLNIKVRQLLFLLNRQLQACVIRLSWFKNRWLTANFTRF